MKEEFMAPEGTIFDGYKVKKSFYQSTGRWNVYLSHPTKKTASLSMMYARYLVCLKENRILDTNEVVDHVDGDKRNDSIDNLEIVTARENVQRHFLLKKKKEEAIKEWIMKPFFEKLFQDMAEDRWFRKRISQLLAESL